MHNNQFSDCVYVYVCINGYIRNVYIYTHVYICVHTPIPNDHNSTWQGRGKKNGGRKGGAGDSHSLHRVTNSPVNTQWAQLGLKDIKRGGSDERGGGEIVATRRHRSAVFASDWPLPILGKNGSSLQVSRLQ